jgi:hypothetical protein
MTIELRTLCTASLICFVVSLIFAANPNFKTEEKGFWNRFHYFLWGFVIPSFVILALIYFVLVAAGL